MLTLPAGAVIADDYRVVRRLGQGGMGIVYVAEQISTGKRRALKVMQPDVASDAQARERFAQEARVGAIVGSEHVVDVIGAGIDAKTGLPWLAMELLEGCDLATYVRARGGPLSRREAREVMAPLSAGLAAAHRAKVVHRDLKPENVFLARGGDGGAVVVKILDFGIAKLVRADVTTTSSIGTPLWMAPEQSSTHARISAATDVWALGLIAFFLLAGRPYWKETRSTMEVLREVLVEPLAPASERARALGADAALPASFDHWFARCVARDPAARFADAGEAAAALLPLLEGDGPGLELPAPASTSPDAPTMEAPGISPYDPTVAAPPPVAPARVRRAFPASALAIAAVVVATGAVLAALFARRSISTSAPAARSTKPRDAISGAMVRFAGGTFQMGSDADSWRGPRHAVLVAPFWIDRTEVTARAYRACFDAGACPAALQTTEKSATFELAGGEDRAINWVSWSAAHEFCAWAGKRLPTEAEWEFAAAGGAAQRRYPWGEGEPGGDVCWKRDYRDPPCAVGSSPGDRTPEGLFDMAGNVKEWTASRFCFYSDPECTIDSGVPMRAVRGAFYGDKTAALLQVTVRMPMVDNGASESQGFRCAR